MNIISEIMKMKAAAPFLAASKVEDRNKALETVADALVLNRNIIFEANSIDLKKAEESNISESIIKRLRFDEHKLNDCVSGIRQLCELPDPIGKITLSRELDENLVLYRKACPIGVIGVIFEARPDALIQISSLCLKSGNCAVLKGGSETKESNKAIFSIIHDAIVKAGIPSECMLQLEGHSEINELLECYGLVDLIIPRGSNAFVRYIMDNTRIPVMGHADGICHVYVDESCNMDEAINIIVDAKTQYTAACNAAETLLINRKIAPALVPALAEKLKENGVKLRGTAEINAFFPVEIIADDDFKNEYLDKIISIKLVEDVNEAVKHINRFGSHHTDVILSDIQDNIDLFMQLVDSACVFANCSTRFSDGFRFGFGAEVGISTSKIHARGPVGLEGLVTYKYNLYGQGQKVGDYASGKSQFHFKDR